MRTVSFTVYGRPQPQGSARAVPVKGYARPFITTDNKKLKPWRQEMTAVIVSLREECFGPHVPLFCDLKCYFQRPKTATVKKRPGMTTKPDGDKLMRAVWDAMKGVLIPDDSHFVDGRVRKFYGDPERIEVQIGEL